MTRENLYLRADEVLTLLYKQEIGEIESPDFLDEYFGCKFLESPKDELKEIKQKRIDRRAVIEVLRRDEMLEMEIGFKIIGEVKISDKGIVFFIEGGYKSILDQEKGEEIEISEIHTKRKKGKKVDKGV